MKYFFLKAPLTSQEKKSVIDRLKLRFEFTSIQALQEVNTWMVDVAIDPYFEPITYDLRELFTVVPDDPQPEIQTRLSSMQYELHLIVQNNDAEAALEFCKLLEKEGFPMIYPGGFA